MIHHSIATMEIFTYFLKSGLKVISYHTDTIIRFGSFWTCTTCNTNCSSDICLSQSRAQVQNRHFRMKYVRDKAKNNHSGPTGAALEGKNDKWPLITSLAINTFTFTRRIYGLFMRGTFVEQIRLIADDGFIFPMPEMRRVFLVYKSIYILWYF